MNPPDIQGMRDGVRLPPLRKIQFQCCGYVALMGSPAPWTCPGCGKAHGAA